MFKGHKYWGTATVGSRGQIVIPVEARDKMGINEGEKLIVISPPGPLNGQGMMLIKAEFFEEMLQSMEAGFNELKNIKNNLGKK
jgi:AbrB family looped-hinge helix DNA binding protein